MVVGCDGMRLDTDGIDGCCEGEDGEGGSEGEGIGKDL